MTYLFCLVVGLLCLWRRRATPEDEAVTRLFWTSGIVLAVLAMGLAFVLDRLVIYD